MTTHGEDGRDEYLTAAAAMKELGVRAQTLYAYVSRGLIHSVQLSGKRRRGYSARDVGKLKVRAQARSGHAANAAVALHGDQPILTTHISTITPLGVRYRGQLSIDMAAEGMSFEAVAELLWSGTLPPHGARWAAEPLPEETMRLIGSLQDLTFEQLPEVYSLVALSLRLQRGLVRGRLKFGEPLAAARQVIQTFVGCFGLASSARRFVTPDGNEDIAACLARSVRPTARPEDIDLFRILLVLMAEHELAPGTFAARIAASSGAAIQPCIAAAICTQTGTRVGCVQDLAEESLLVARSPGMLIEQARVSIANGLIPPGFVNAFYPDGDPRCRYILDLLSRRTDDCPALAEVIDYVAEVWRLAKVHPRHEIAIAAVGLLYDLPKGFGSAISVLSRCAGWTAHILEQREDSIIIRPRATFVS